MTVHLCDYASQPDLRIACTQEWTVPQYGGASGTTSEPGVYRAESGQLYTFIAAKVTCGACQARDRLYGEMP